MRKSFLSTLIVAALLTAVTTLVIGADRATALDNSSRTPELIPIPALTQSGAGFSRFAQVVQAEQLTGQVTRGSDMFAEAAVTTSCPPFFSWDDGEGASMYGYTVGEIGDINGDGWSDLAVSAAGYGSDAGRLYLYSGLDQLLMFTITGENPGDYFGAESLPDAADFNNDGYGDILTGAWNYSAVISGAGRAYIFYGGPGPFPADRSAADADVIIDGEGALNNFGFTHAILGDVDGDLCSDFAIGESQYVRESGPGRVYVYSGQIMDTIYTLVGEVDRDMFGANIRPAGDVNGDGTQDFVVGACFNVWATSEQRYGHAYVFSGPDGQMLYKFTGEMPRGAFGVKVDGAGDVNQDGFDDIIVGAHLNDSGANNVGCAFVFHGGTGTYPISVDAQDAVYRFSGNSVDDQLGWPVAGIGDIDLDGYDDVAVGVTAYNAANNRPGEVNVYSGLDGSLLGVLTAGVQRDDFGRSITMAWDSDQDGMKDLMIGAPSLLAGTPQMHCILIADLDQDSVMAGCDNCPSDANTGQEDFDTDTYGDVCDICPRYVTPGDIGFDTGDIDQDGKIDAADIILMVNYIFKSGPPPVPIPEAGDVNFDDDHKVTSADIIYEVNYVFKSGPAPLDACAL